MARRGTSRGRDVNPNSEQDDDLNIPLRDLGHGPSVDRGEDARPAVPQPDLTAVFSMMAQTMQAQQRLQEEQLRRQVEQERRPRQAEDGMRSSYERLRKAGMPSFEGTTNPELAEKWLKDLEKNFRVLEVKEEMKGELAVSFLTGEAERWWDGVAPAYVTRDRPLTWEVFKKAFLDNYFPETLRLERQKEFFYLKQTEAMSVVEYAAKFNSLGRFVPEFMANENLKLLRFRDGLHGRIQGKMAAIRSQSYTEIYEIAISVEADMKRADAARTHKKSRPVRNQEQNSKSSPKGPQLGVKKFPFKKETTGGQRKPCEPCNNIHLGECRWKTGACFKCGKLGHKIGNCPEMAPVGPNKSKEPMKQTNSQPNARPNARVFALTTEDVENASDVVTDPYGEE